MAMDTNLQQSLGRLVAGPCAVMLDPDSTKVEIYANDGVTLRFTQGAEEANTDIVGLYDIYSAGDRCEVDVNLDEQSMSIIDTIFAHGLDGTTYRGIGSSAGSSLRDNALAMRIRPWQTRTADTSQIELWYVAPFGDSVLAAGKTAPWRWTQTFLCFPDVSRIDGLLLGKLTFPARS